MVKLCQFIVSRTPVSISILKTKYIYLLILNLLTLSVDFGSIGLRKAGFDADLISGHLLLLSSSTASQER